MSIKIVYRTISLTLIILVVIFCLSAQALAVMLDSDIGGAKEGGKAEYVPGQVLVKFKEGADPQAVLHPLKIDAPSISRVHSISQKVANFRKDYKLEPDSSGWYSFLGKSYREVSEIPDEEIFKEIYADMPPQEKSLYRVYKITLPEGLSVEDAVSELSDNPDVEYAEPNYIMKIQAFPETLPNDAYVDPDQDNIWSVSAWGQGYEDTWGLKKIKADKAWPSSQGDGIVVAVIDTGVDYNHEDLRGNIYRDAANRVIGYDFSDNDDDPMDADGHGTHVAGIIAAIGNNRLGMIGVAPHAKIMPVKIFPNGSSDVSAQAIRWAADSGARVLNNSWGPSGKAPSNYVIEEAIAYAHDVKGCVVIFAAGNSNKNVAYYSPQNYPKTITVAASTQNDEKVSFSNYGSGIDITAPGGGYEDELGGERLDKYNILSTMSDASVMAQSYPQARVAGGYWRLGGTSMACPYVSGLAALILSKYPWLANEPVRHIIQASSDDLGETGKDDFFGSGRINAHRALNTLVHIYNPAMDSYARGIVNVQGWNYITAGDMGYELWCSPKADPDEHIFIAYISAMPAGLFSIPWNTAAIPDGEYVLHFKILRSDGSQGAVSLDVTVDNVNDPPVFDKLSDIATRAGETLVLRPGVRDPDDPATPSGSQFAYSVSGQLPPGAVFDAETQVFTWLRQQSDKNIYSVTFTVTNYGLAVSKTIYLIPIEEKRITADPSGQTGPRIYGDKIVWKDSRLIQPYSNNHIYMYDLTGQREIRISSGEWPKDDPVIYGNKIVWTDWEDYVNLHLYDIATGEESAVMLSGEGQFHPAVYENRIVWEEDLFLGSLPPTHNRDIYMYDLSSVQLTRITTDISTQSAPAIYGSKIVWEDLRNGGSSIYMYDLATYRESAVAPNTGEQWYPAVYGDKIVWVDDRNINGDIYMYDINIGREEAVSTEGSLQTYPAIFGNKIVWTDARNGNGDIYMYDTGTGREVRITGDVNRQRKPSIYEEKIVWEDYRNGNADIYMATLAFAPRIASVSPTKVATGSLLTIAGNYFGSTRLAPADYRVEFTGGVFADTIEYWSGTEIRCRVPQGVQAGPVRVINPCGSSNGADVTVNRVPWTSTLYTSPAGAAKPGQLVYFAAKYVDMDGWQDLDSVSFLVNTSSETGANCFKGLYMPQTNLLYLMNDAGTAWLGGFAPGSASIIKNSYSELDCSKTKVSKSGVLVAVTWAVKFKTTFAGTKNLYMSASDKSSASSGWVYKGQYRINSAPTTVSVTPSSGTYRIGSWYDFTSTYADADGSQDLTKMQFRSGSYWVQYDKSQNKLFMWNGKSWVGGVAPGSDNRITTTYGTLDAKYTTVRPVLTDKYEIKWRVSFVSKNAGTYDIKLTAYDMLNTNSGAVTRGRITISQ